VGGFPDALDTAVGWSWMVEIGGWPLSEVTTVEGIKMELDAIDLKTNLATGGYLRKKLPGRMKSGTLTITRAAAGPPNPTATHLTDWFTEVLKTDMAKARQSVIIRILDYGGLPIQSFCAKNAWPTTVDYGTFKAGDTNVITEKITLHHEGLYVGETPGDY